MISQKSQKPNQSILAKRESSQFLTEIPDFSNRKSKNQPESKVNVYHDCTTLRKIIKLKQILANPFETNPNLFFIWPN